MDKGIDLDELDKVLVWFHDRVETNFADKIDDLVAREVKQRFMMIYEVANRYLKIMRD